MTEQNSGFTLIELMIVTAIIAVIASIAIPNLQSARLNSNEAAAIATLKAISSAQAQFQTSGAVDGNNNGTGEFGYLAELAGGVGLRNAAGDAGPHRLSPALLSHAFGNIATLPTMKGGAATRSGYRFQMFLPVASSFGMAEADAGGVNFNSPEPSKAESLWCC